MPPTLRRTSGGSARDGVESLVVGVPERNAVALLAEDARRRARLQCVWVFAHLAGAGAEDVARDIARACADDTKHGMPDDAARAAGLRALEGSRGRFARRVATFDGLHVALAEPPGRRALSVVASAPDRPRLGPEAEAPLVDLAEIAARVVGLPLPAAAREQPEAKPRRPAGYGAGLADALALLERPPVLAESRVRVARALAVQQPSLAAAIRTLETDLGMAVAVVRAANGVSPHPRGGIASLPTAIEALGPRGVLDVVGPLPVLPPFGSADPLGAALLRISAHAIATRAAVDLLAKRLDDAPPEELRLIALLHDLGKIALAAADPEHIDPAVEVTVPPEERVAEERRRLGLDHAALGAIALQRLGLPKRMAAAVEGHHAPGATGAAAIVRLADMLAHQAHGHAVRGAVLVEAGRRLGLGAEELRRLAYDVTRASESRAVAAEPSPLTPSQQKVLEGLAGGKTYKQIAADLSLSVSTVRSHLHRVYERLGVADRAQAVLLARERGWL